MYNNYMYDMVKRNQMMIGGNPMMIGGNPMMIGENPMMVGGNPLGININPLMGGINMEKMISEQQKKYKQQQMIKGYLFAKEVARKQKEAELKNNKQNTNNNTTNINANNSQSSNNSKITVNFQKGGVTTKIEMETTSAIFELIYEFCEKTNTKIGTFKFGNETLSPSDSRNLSEAGLKNGDIIIVS